MSTVKQICLWTILGICLLESSAYAQFNNHIFKGGGQDGHAKEGFAQLQNNFIFSGGTQDGYANSSYFQPLNNLVFIGGAGDGHVVFGFVQNINNSIYSGGRYDGHVSGFFRQPQNNKLFSGGFQDGHSKASYAQSVNNPLFAGGDYEGHYVGIIKQASNNNIFAGSNEDGHDMEQSYHNPFVPHIIYVDSSATGERTGYSWADAFVEISDAFALATAFPQIDSILVARGKYLPHAGFNRTASFDIPDYINLLGGFPSGGGALGVRDHLIYPTRLSGDIGATNNASDNTYHVITIDASDAGILLDGFYIQDGNANQIFLNNRRGAGIFGSGPMTFRNIVFLNNVGTSSGSVIYASGSKATITLQDCQLKIASGSSTIQILNTNQSTLSMLGQFRISND